QYTCATLMSIIYAHANIVPTLPACLHYSPNMVLTLRLSCALLAPSDRASRHRSLSVGGCTIPSRFFLDRSLTFFITVSPLRRGKAMARAVRRSSRSAASRPRPRRRAYKKAVVTFLDNLA